MYVMTVKTQTKRGTRTEQVTGDARTMLTERARFQAEAKIGEVVLISVREI